MRSLPSITYFICITELLYATPIGIIGGRGGTGIEPPYGALVEQNETLTTLSGGSPPTSTNINIISVAINDAGTGLIGGIRSSGNPAYAAVVAPNGTRTPLSGGSFPSISGAISAVAINQTGAGVIGGSNSTGTSSAYAALFASNTIHLVDLSNVDFPYPNGAIDSVAINNGGSGLIGGQKGKTAYAAYFNSHSILTTLAGAGFPVGNGKITSVAINSSGNGIIGGANGVAPYVSFVAANGHLTTISGPSIPSMVEVTSVAINDAGNGIFGGGSSVGPSFAILVASNSALTPLSSPRLSSISIINSVAINKSGTSIIGGQNAFTPTLAYAALFAPNGTLIQELSGAQFPNLGDIQSVAINDAGVGLIGGQDNSTGGAYAALIAPNGTLTLLSNDTFPSLSGKILSVALNNNPILIPSPLRITPASIFSVQGTMNTQLAATYAFTTHLTTSLSAPYREIDPDCTPLFYDCTPDCCLWAAPFGAHIQQKSSGANPPSRNDIAGALLGLDYYRSDLLLTGGLGYSYNNIHFKEGKNREYLQEEIFFLSATYQQKHFWINETLFAGPYQLYNKRYTLSAIRSTAHTHGWLISPHIEIATPFSIYQKRILSIEPFVSCDYLNNWQHGFREKGSSGLNLIMPRLYTSLLCGEAGFRFYEELSYFWGVILLEEKISYVTQKPFHVKPVTTAFVASPSSFPIAIGSSKTENMGSFSLNVSFIPNNSLYPYCTIDLSKESGSSYRAYLVSLEIGKNF